MPCSSWAVLLVAVFAQGKPALGKIAIGQFALSYDARGVRVSNPQDPYGAEFLTQGTQLGEPVVKYKVQNRDWADLTTKARTLEADPDHALVYTDSDKDSPLKMVQRFRSDGRILDWTIEIEATTILPEALDWFGLRFAKSDGQSPANAWKLEISEDATEAQKIHLRQLLDGPDATSGARRTQQPAKQILRGTP